MTWVQSPEPSGVKGKSQFPQIILWPPHVCPHTHRSMFEKQKLQNKAPNPSWFCILMSTYNPVLCFALLWCRAHPQWWGRRLVVSRVSARCKGHKGTHQAPYSTQALKKLVTLAKQCLRRMQLAAVHTLGWIRQESVRAKRSKSLKPKGRKSDRASCRQY